METKTIKGYKGFDKDLKCRDFQYKIGETYETDNAKICNTGFHFCENPFDVFKYYAPCSNKNGFNRFCEVYGSGEVDRDGSKIACSKIKIGAEIKLDGLIKAGVKFILDRVKWDNNKNTGDYSAATNTGDCSAATNTGYYSVATNTGHRSAATNTGDYSAATNTGDCSAATNTGDCSVATNTGDCSVATVKGKCSISVVTGKDSKAKGALGCWIVLAERGDWDGEKYPIIEVKAFKVDGEQVKADTFYMLVNGELKEVE